MGVSMKIKALALLSLTVALMGGCATTTPVKNGVASFPDLNKATFSHNGQTKGSWVDWGQLAKIEHGMSKDQIYDLIGKPHFREGLYNQHIWNYVFNYRDGNGEHQVCQYQLTYNKDYLVDGMYFKDRQCEDYMVQALKPKVITNEIKVIYKEHEKAKKNEENIVLKSDALFAFDKYTLADDIKPDGIMQLDAVARKLKDLQAKGNVSIYVIGHTDRLGDDSYNYALSQKRADTIKSYFQSKGVNPASITALGAGETKPVKDGCFSGTKKQMIDCLQPNRRVEINIIGY